MNGRATLERWRPQLGITVLTLGALAFYLVHSLREQALYLTTGYDLGIFDQAVRAYAHFQAPIVPLKGAGANIFGDHFHPIIAVLAPLYWIWDSPNMLLIAQAVLTAAAIPVVYRFALRRTGPAMSLVFATAFAFGWGVQSLIDYDFHEIAFATPLLALAINALDQRKDRQFVLWAGLLLLVREDMGILVAVLALLLLAQRRAPKRAVTLFVVGVLTFLVTTDVIIPHFAAGHAFTYNGQFGALGNSVPAALANVLTQPWHAVDVYFTPFTKTRTLLFLLVPFALLPLRSRYSLLALPLLAERFLNVRHNLWLSEFHYNALPWLIFTLASIDAAHRLGLFEQRRRARLLRCTVGAVLLLAPLVLIGIGPPNRVVPITALRSPDYHTGPGWLTSARAVVAYLPADVCIVADTHLVPHLTSRDWTTVAEANPPSPDFIALDLAARDTGGNPPAPKPLPVFADALAAHYRVVFSAGSFVVLRAPGYTGPSAACAPLGPGRRSR